MAFKTASHGALRRSDTISVTITTVKVMLPAAPTPCTILPLSNMPTLSANAAMIAPARNRARATSSTGLRPNTLENDAKIGWNTVDARRKLVARLKVAVVVLLRD
jgi:hypothetical protein